jgi:hypothetical protein
MPVTHVAGDPLRTSLDRSSLRGPALADASARAAAKALSQRQLVMWSLLVRPDADHG